MIHQLRSVLTSTSSPSVPQWWRGQCRPGTGAASGRCRPPTGANVSPTYWAFTHTGSSLYGGRRARGGPPPGPPGLAAGECASAREATRPSRWAWPSPRPRYPAPRLCTPWPEPPPSRPGCGGGRLEILLVAYSGLRWGEHVALTADRVAARRRRITVDRQVIETRSALELTLPKGRRRRVTMFPRRHPRRHGPRRPGRAAVGRDRGRRPGSSPLPGAALARRFNYGRNAWDPAAKAAGWPRTPAGR